MSLTVLATVLAKLSAGGAAAKGAVGVAVAVAAIGTAGTTALVTVSAEEPATGGSVTQTEAPVEEEVAETPAPVEEVVAEEVVAEEPVVEEPADDEPLAEEPAVGEPAEDESEAESEEDGPKAGTFGEKVHEIKAAGGTGQDVAAAAHEKNAEKKAVKAAAGKGKKSERVEQAPVSEEPVVEPTD